MGEMGIGRAMELQTLQSKDAEIDRLRQGRNNELALVACVQSKDAEIDRLRQDRNQELALVERLRTQPARATPRGEYNQFDKARMDMELYLERRERNIEVREAMLPRGGRCVAGVQCGSLWDSLQR